MADLRLLKRQKRSKIFFDSNKSTDEGAAILKTLLADVWNDVTS